MAAGGDGYTMFEGKPFVAEAGLLSDALADYLRAVGEVEPKVEGRIITEGKLSELESEPEVTPEPAPSSSTRCNSCKLHSKSRRFPMENCC